MAENYPLGAKDNPDAPYNRPLDREIQVEVNVEIGTFINVTIPQYQEGDYLNINEDELCDSVADAVKKKLNIDNDDIILNDICIQSYQ